MLDEEVERGAALCARGHDVSAWVGLGLGDNQTLRAVAYRAVPTEKPLCHGS